MAMTHESLHDYGAKHYGALWFIANSKAVDAARAFGLDHVEHKMAIGLIVLRTLQSAPLAKNDENEALKKQLEKLQLLYETQSALLRDVY